MLTAWTKLPLAKASYVTTDLDDGPNSFWGSLSLSCHHQSQLSVPNSISIPCLI